MKSRFFKDWFSFSQGERKGIIILALLLLAFLVIPLLLRHCNSQSVPEPDIAQLREQAAKLTEATAPQEFDTVAPVKVVKPQPATFAFDPNTISHDSLMLLGFSQKQAAAIIKYRERGAVFRSAADFLKINVITDRQREQLQSLVTITSVPVRASSFKQDTASRAKVYTKPQVIVELNTADTAQLRTLPGIGSYFAQKIVEYREALGGYVSTEQLVEINNFGYERLQKLAGRISVNTEKVQRFELTEENLEFMRHHPYIGAYTARGVAQYAKRKGAPATIDELSDNNVLTSLQAQKLRPYVK